MFGVQDYGAFSLAVLVFLALPGPGTLTLLHSTAQGGFRAGALATFGVAAGDQILLWTAVAGLAALLKAHPVAFALLQWAGAGYLVVLGLQLIFARPRGGAEQASATSRHFRRALWITLLNPKAIVFYLAFFPLFIDPARQRGLVTFGAMSLTIFAITLAYCLLLCAFADRVQRMFAVRPSWGTALRRLTGLALIGFSVRLLRPG